MVVPQLAKKLDLTVRPRLSGSAVRFGRALNLYATPGEVSVHAVGASGAPLTNLAVAHGDDVLIVLYGQADRATGACRQPR